MVVREEGVMAHTRRLLDHIYQVADELVDYAADRKNARTMINLIDTNVRLKYNTFWGSWFLGQILKYTGIRVRESDLNDIVTSLDQCNDPLLFLKTIIIFTDHGGWGPTSVNTNFMYQWISKLKNYQESDPDPSLVLTAKQVEYLRNCVEERVKARESEIKFLQARQQARKDELALMPKVNVQQAAAVIKKDFENHGKPAIDEAKEKNVAKLDMAKFNDVTATLSVLFQARMSNVGTTKKIVIPSVQEAPFQEIPMKDVVVENKKPATAMVQEHPFADIPMVSAAPVKTSKSSYVAPPRNKMVLNAGHLAALNGIFAKPVSGKPAEKAVEQPKNTF